MDADPFRRIRLVERDSLLFKRNVEGFEQNPGAQRPRRIILVAEVERIHGVLAGGLPSAPASGPKRRQNGTVFPGFMIPFGSSARLIDLITSTASPCSCASRSSLCQPMPCSPVQVPPM